MKEDPILAVDALGPLKGKTIILRVDINSPVDPKSKTIGPNARIQAHAKTIALLSSKGARLIVLGHQGRKGDKDFLPLSQHAKLLSKLSGKPVLFTPDQEVYSQKTLDKAKGLKDGQVMLLDNVRYLDEETASHTPQEQAHLPMVQALGPIAHFYVDDAFSNAHRSHESMTGFPQVLASAAGPVMLSELEGARGALEPAKRPSVYVLGGAKPEEVVGIMKYALEHSLVDKILTCGLVGELCVIARGSTLSEEKMKWLKDNGYDKSLLALREVMHAYHEFIETPFDFAVKDAETGKRREVFLTMLKSEKAPSGDIGKKTAAKFSKIVARSKTVYVKGPCGMYEDPEFSYGTYMVFSAVAANQSGYTLVAGGNTSDAFNKLKIPTNNISHVSIGGGVLLELMAGQKLPAVEALRQAAKEFGNKPGYHAPKPLAPKVEEVQKAPRAPRKPREPKPAKPSTMPKAAFMRAAVAPKKKPAAKAKTANKAGKPKGKPPGKKKKR